MPIRQHFLDRTLDGRPYVSFWQWANSLPESERRELQDANDRQLAFRREAIRSGNLVVDPRTNDYIWRDETASEVKKQQDPIWVSYWQRWMRECAIDPDHSVMKSEDQ